MIAIIVGVIFVVSVLLARFSMRDLMPPKGKGLVRKILSGTILLPRRRGDGN
jgi:hypothetical protein